MPWWGWLIVVAAICAPIKMHFFKKYMTKQQEKKREKEANM